MSQEIELNWKGNRQFEAEVLGHKVKLDDTIESGGEGTGPSPKRMMLVALAGCTAMDVTSILQKMKEPLKELKIKIKAEVSEEHPKIYTAVHISYNLRGDNLEKLKVEKAVNLSLDKYCSVTAMFRSFAKVTFEINYL